MSKDPERFFDVLFKSNYDKMVNTAFRTLGCMENAEDMVQEVFLTAIEKWDIVSVHENQLGWIFKTLNNLAKNEKRKYIKHAESPLNCVPEQAESQREPLWYALPKQMSEDDKQILIWKFDVRMDYRQIADRLGISESACRSKVSRALGRYKKLAIKK